MPSESRSVNFCLTDTWFFRECAWRNFEAGLGSSRHKEIKTFPLFIWRNSRLSRPKAYVPCALVHRVVGAWNLDVDFWREKIRGKILDPKLQNPPSICCDGNWQELTCSDAICWRNIEINKIHNLRTTRKSWYSDWSWYKYYYLILSSNHWQM